MAKPLGRLNLAESALPLAKPPFTERPSGASAPEPAIVVTEPSGRTSRMRCAASSAT